MSHFLICFHSSIFGEGLRPRGSELTKHKKSNLSKDCNLDNDIFSFQIWKFLFKNYISFSPDYLACVIIKLIAMQKLSLVMILFH